MSTTESLLFAASSSLAAQQLDLSESLSYDLLQQLFPCDPETKRATKVCTTRRRLSYQLDRVFTSAVAFREWWDENEAEQWVYNSTYQVKNADEIQAYRCTVRNCPQRIRIVYGVGRTEIRVQRSTVGHEHEETVTNPLTSEIKTQIEALEAEGVTANRIRQQLCMVVSEQQLPTLKQIQNFVARLRLKRIAPPQASGVVNFDSDNLIPRRRRGRPRKSSIQSTETESSLASLLNESLLRAVGFASVDRLNEMKSEIKTEKNLD